MELLEYLEKLEILESEKNWDEILSLVEEAISNYTYSLSLKTYKVKALLNKNRFSDAKELCFELIKSNPGSSVIHSLLASIFEKTGEIKKAIDEYNKIIFLNPGDTDAIKELERLKKGDNFVNNDSVAEELSDSRTYMDEEEEKGKDIVNGVEEEEDEGEKKNDDNGNDFSSENPNKASVSDEKSDDDEYDYNPTNNSDIIEQNNSYLENNIESKDMPQVKVDEEESFNNNEVNEFDMNYKEESKNDEEILEDYGENIGLSDKVEKDLSFTENYDKDEEPFVTYSMAKLLEEQGKYKDAQAVYKKLYIMSNDKKADVGFKRVGLKRFQKVLNNYLVREKSNE